MTTDQPTAEKPLRQLTAQEFIDIITEVDREHYAEFYQASISGDQIIIKDVEITKDVLLTSDITVHLPLIILSGTFTKCFVIQGSTFNGHLWIGGGTFREDFLITSGTFNNSFWINGGLFNENFWIQGGLFNEYSWIQGGLFSKEFVMIGGVFSKEFNIEGGTFNGNSAIGGGNYKEDFRIKGGTFTNGFGITGGIFDKGFLIGGGTFSEIFTISGGTFNKNYRISGGTFKQDFEIFGGTFVEALEITDGAFEKEVAVIKGYVYKLIITHLTPTLRLQIGGGCRINSLSINSTLPKDSLLRISGSLYCLAFKDVQNFGTIVLTGLSFHEQPFIPKGVTLPDDEDRPENAQLRIINSDLGKTTFIDCDLSGFGLEFKSSKITDVFVTGTKMPDRIITPEHSQQQLGYSQIKKIYENRGDKVQANYFFAREMNAYYESLDWAWPWHTIFWEKSNLWLNKFSTNHGQSWQRGLATTLGVGGLFYTIYCWLLGISLAWPTETTGARFGEVLSYFIEFINPIHKTDYVAEQLLGKSAHINNLARTIESISRIFIAYFVYQLIQAFRKHGRSSS